MTPGEPMQINLPDVHAELTALFVFYEDALVHNKVEVLDSLFWDSPHTVRYGSAENLVGIEAIRAFRLARSAAGLARTLRETVITTYGRDFATTMTEFLRPSYTGPEGDLVKVGRQSQTWCRVGAPGHGGWRVVAGHVSLLDLSR